MPFYHKGATQFPAAGRAKFHGHIMQRLANVDPWGLWLFRPLPEAANGGQYTLACVRLFQVFIWKTIWQVWSNEVSIGQKEEYRIRWKGTPKPWKYDQCLSSQDSPLWWWESCALKQRIFVIEIDKYPHAVLIWNELIDVWRNAKRKEFLNLCIELAWWWAFMSVVSTDFQSLVLPTFNDEM